MSAATETTEPLRELNRHHVVICVDDEAPILASLQRLLRREPFELLTTQNPDTALEWVDRRDVSLFIADQRMPEMSGTDLLQRVQQRSPGTLNMMLTGFPDREVIRARARSGISRLVTKPWDDRSLREMIRQLLQDKEQQEETLPPGARRRWWTPDLEEMVIEVECRRKSSRETIAEIARYFSRPGTSESGVVLVLRDLLQLRDSISLFLKDLTFRAVAADVPITLLDPTGCAGTLIEEIGGIPPTVACVSPVPDARRRNVLIVEPHDDTRAFLHMLIESLGHPCDAVPSFEEALPHLEKGGCSLTLLDLSLPNLGGLAMVQYITDRSLPVDVLALTSRRNGEEWEMPERPPILRRISKPYRVKDLVEPLL